MVRGTGTTVVHQALQTSKVVAVNFAPKWSSWSPSSGRLVVRHFFAISFPFSLVQYIYIYLFIFLLSFFRSWACVAVRRARSINSIRLSRLGRRTTTASLKVRRRRRGRRRRRRRHRWRSPGSRRCSTAPDCDASRRCHARKWRIALKAPVAKREKRKEKVKTRFENIISRSVTAAFN